MRVDPQRPARGETVRNGEHPRAHEALVQHGEPVVGEGTEGAGLDERVVRAHPSLARHEADVECGGHAELVEPHEAPGVAVAHARRAATVEGGRLPEPDRNPARRRARHCALLRLQLVQEGWREGVRERGRLPASVIVVPRQSPQWQRARVARELGKVALAPSLARVRHVRSHHHGGVCAVDAAHDGLQGPEVARKLGRRDREPRWQVIGMAEEVRLVAELPSQDN
mmetsp:Transcript_64473/g.129540  ORF Transcript_64473/g.129540 Transcript_64473/m.129540 type:complete len:226 (+) Transcript_64473:462-1139(+)